MQNVPVKVMIGTKLTISLDSDKLLTTVNNRTFKNECSCMEQRKLSILETGTIRMFFGDYVLRPY